MTPDRKGPSLRSPKALIARHVTRGIDRYTATYPEVDKTRLDELEEVVETWKRRKSGLVVKKARLATYRGTITSAQVEYEHTKAETTDPTLVMRVKSHDIAEGVVRQVVKGDFFDGGIESALIHGAGMNTWNYGERSRPASTAVEIALVGRAERRARGDSTSQYPFDYAKIRFDWNNETQALKVRGRTQEHNGEIPNQLTDRRNQEVTLIDFAHMRHHIIKQAHKHRPDEH
ncbi:MAG: hypothetical protein H0W89_06035 [Candidatus Levybacteria bacterium]|nr:hypothetical protein [Candidatus Levybacteria bacterium]